MTAESFNGNDRLKRVVFSEEEIKAKVAEAGKYLSEKYEGKPLLLVSILKGAFIFLSDLCRAVTIPCEIGFMCARSYYNGMCSSGVVNVTMDVEQDVSKYHVVIVEDIIDTGRTLHDIAKMIKLKKPMSLEIITLLDKPDRRLIDFEADMSLFTVPDIFLVGYGLDCGEQFRNLPYIAEYQETT